MSFRAVGAAGKARRSLRRRLRRRVSARRETVRARERRVAPDARQGPSHRLGRGGAGAWRGGCGARRLASHPVLACRPTAPPLPRALRAARWPHSGRVRGCALVTAGPACRTRSPSPRRAHRCSSGGVNWRTPTAIAATVAAAASGHQRRRAAIAPSRRRFAETRRLRVARPRGSRRRATRRALPRQRAPGAIDVRTDERLAIVRRRLGHCRSPSWTRSFATA